VPARHLRLPSGPNRSPASREGVQRRRCREFYDPFTDFIPISGISDFGYVIGTNAGSRFADLEQALAEMRRRPGAVNVGTSAAGTSPYFMAELLKIMAKVDFAIVPYRLTSELTMSMLRGDVDVYIDTFGAFKSSWGASARGPWRPPGRRACRCCRRYRPSTSKA
jgi:tripartite-type tricarboxylate transporter receptor subunit TctC